MKRDALMLAQTAHVLNMPVVLTSTNQLIAELAGSWASPAGGALVQLIIGALATYGHPQ